MKTALLPNWDFSELLNGVMERVHASKVSILPSCANVYVYTTVKLCYINEDLLIHKFFFAVSFLKFGAHCK